MFRIFSPSFRNVPFTGLEWSFKFRDEGFDCEGYKLNHDSESRRVRRGSSLNPDGEGEEDEDIEMITISSLTEDQESKNNTEN